MWLAFRTGIFFFSADTEIPKQPHKIKKTKDEIMKYVRKSIMSYEIVNQDIENTGKNIKSSEEVMEVVKEIEILLEVITAIFYGLPTNKVKYLKDLN